MIRGNLTCWHNAIAMARLIWLNRRAITDTTLAPNARIAWHLRPAA